MSKSIDRKSLRLLKAIWDKTHGRQRAVRDVAELESGLTPEQARDGYRDLLGLGLIESFSQEYAARLSPAGVEFIESGQMPPDELLRLCGKVIVRGAAAEAREAVAQLIEQCSFQAVLLDEQADLMSQVDAQGQVSLAVILLTPDDLGRMNVLMELGYLIGRIGRGKVCALAVGSDAAFPRDLASVTLVDESGLREVLRAIQ